MKKIKSLLLTFLVVVAVTKANAQVGIGTTNPFAALDVFSSNDGLLIPRVALTATATVLPVLTGTESELVYNTNTAGDVTPGFYYLSTATGPWVRLANGATNSWLITGNSNIVDGTNFLGTTNDVDFAFRRNNLTAGKIGTTSTSFGLSSANSNTAAGTTAFGVSALAANVSAVGNTAIGYTALAASTAANNTAVGYGAADALITTDNTAVGFNALGTTAGANSTAIGSNAGLASTGADATLVGYQAGTSNTGAKLTAIGALAGRNNTGIQNTYLGYNAGALINQAASANNVAVGFNAMQSNTGRVNSSTVAIGAFALENVANGAGNNTAVGFQTATNLSGSNNVILGYQASGTSGSNSTSIGQGANFATFSNATALGNGATAGASDNMKFGNASIIANHFSGKIGLAAVGVVPNGALDLNVTNDGIVPPKAALTSTAIVLPVLTGVAGELIYNTNTAGDVTPGYYYLSTATGPWVRVGTSSNAWDILGNSNIVDGTNFLGTTNDVDVALRRNNLPAGKIGTTSTSFGVGALNAGAATNSTAFGTNALLANTTGNDNVAVGNGALAANITGTYNTAVGTSALAANTANGNTAVGFTALGSSTGGDNTAVGYQALRANTTGIQNTSVGVNALQQKTTGSANTAIGHSALNAVGTFDNVTAIGYQAGLNNTASNNTLLGFQAGNAVQGSGVVAIGFQAGALIRGGDCVAIGNGAFDGNNDPASQFSIAIGSQAMGGSTGVAAHNVAIGYQALNSTIASNNVAIGTQTCGQTTTGIDNVAVGYNAMAQGNSQQNVAIGRDALMQSPGNGNTAVGYNAGRDTPGDSNTFIGYQTNGTGVTTNTTSIGYQANSIADNQVTLGNGAIATLRCFATTITALSDRRDKANIKKLSEGIDFIKKLKPVTFTWNTRDKLKVGVKSSGFIAQDLLKLQKDSSIGENLDLVDDENPERYEARYGNLLPIMVSGMQEQQELIEQLKKENTELMKTNAAILKRLEKLEKK